MNSNNAMAMAKPKPTDWRKNLFGTGTLGSISVAKVYGSIELGAEASYWEHRVLGQPQELLEGLEGKLKA
ncbi:hypothetical protein NDN08_004252 [Rhodosorus marinus]|uniref:Uncharacterized protein n=1 Tax=Rhodosorus marinus TaxID=101924 RepID=A0AAV8UKR3_9RHOD|nr:hypothetical protein NDN08_004252 [Rhodosorus marinus]